MNKNILFAVYCFFLIACSDQNDTNTAYIDGTKERPPSEKASLKQNIDVSSTIKPVIDTLRTFPLPENTSVLTITGKISQFNKGESLLLDRPTLLSFPQTTITTSTIWTDGINTFKGPLIRDVLDAAGNSATWMSATAINEYVIEIPVKDSEKHPVIFALEQNGKPLSIREKGPLWIIYPWSQMPELNHDKYYSRSIWQLNRLHLHD